MADAPPDLSEVFPGPRPFTAGEAHLFFGRTREAQDLYNLALSYRVVLLYSRSGAGKTSLLNAALLQLLQEADFVPLHGRVAGTASDDEGDTHHSNVHVFNALTTLLRDRISADSAATASLADYFGTAATGRSYFLIFDQFEEFFTLHPDRWRDREPFFAQLRAALKGNPDLHVLISIREDFVANLDPYGDYLPGGLRFRYRLERLRAEEALEAITTPFARAGITFASTELTTVLVRDLSTERLLIGSRTRDIVGEFVEPVHLQVVCRSLLTSLPPGTRTITQADLRAYGNVDEALARYYNSAVSRAVGEYRGGVNAARRLREALGRRRPFEARLRRWIERELITPSGTRAFAFAGAASDAGVPLGVLRTLSRERIVHVEQRAGADWVELSHDRFVGPVRAANTGWREPRRRRLLAVVGVLLLAASAVAGTLVVREQRGAAVREALLETAAELEQQERELLVARAATQRATETAQGFQAVLTTRLDAWGGPPDKDVTPAELDQRLDADSRLERMPVREQCGRVAVVFYVRSSPHPQTRARLIEIWRGFGLTVTEDDVRGIPQPMNAIWRGRDVPPMCWRAIACTLIRAGIPVRRIGQPENDPEGKRMTIEVGYSGPARLDPPITVAELWKME